MILHWERGEQEQPVSASASSSLTLSYLLESQEDRWGEVRSEDTRLSPARHLLSDINIFQLQRRVDSVKCEVS